MGRHVFLSDGCWRCEGWMYDDEMIRWQWDGRGWELGGMMGMWKGGDAMR